MRLKLRETLLFKALVLSLLINALASGAGMLGSLSKPLQFLDYVARAITAPPAFLIGWLIRPKASSLISIVVAGTEGLIFSIVFYTFVLWLLLLLMNRSRQPDAD